MNSKKKQVLRRSLRLLSRRGIVRIASSGWVGPFESDASAGAFPFPFSTGFFALGSVVSLDPAAKLPGVVMCGVTRGLAKPAATLVGDVGGAGGESLLVERTRVWAWGTSLGEYRDLRMAHIGSQGCPWCHHALDRSMSCSEASRPEGPEPEGPEPESRCCESCIRLPG